MNFTPLARKIFAPQMRLTDYRNKSAEAMQRDELRRLLRLAADTEIGRRGSFRALLDERNPERRYAEALPMVKYEQIRGDVMRMLRGEVDVLWPGKCSDFAQSSGTSDGKSKYVPITREGLRMNHYRGGADVVANYLRLVPESRLFAGKSMILGGSFANSLDFSRSGLCVGDLSATLINKVNPIANLFRIPSKKLALLSDWDEKLPALARAAMKADVTGISGVPSWFLTVLLKIMELSGTESILDVWPNLEVFFHGGISFDPYRSEYDRITPQRRLHYLESYNASEGFFAVQNDFDDRAMLLLVNAGVYFELLDADGGAAAPVPAWEAEVGKVYELVISSLNGLWRYRLGDTVRVERTDPLKITMAGRTSSFINAFGEELMEANAERAMAETCRKHGCSVKNYTAAPVYASEGHRGRHEWLIEWMTPPADTEAFADSLDASLRLLNSDYDAKRSGGIFLDRLSIIAAPAGLFELWLRHTGCGKLGGQRKIPRLSNNRDVIESMLRLQEELTV